MLPILQFNRKQIRSILHCHASLDPTRNSFYSEVVNTGTGTTTCRLNYKDNEDYVALVTLSDFNGMGAVIKSHPFKSNGRIMIEHVSLSYSPRTMSSRIPQDMREFADFTENSLQTIRRCINYIENADGALHRYTTGGVTVTCVPSSRAGSAGQTNRPCYVAQAIYKRDKYEAVLNSAQYSDMKDCSVEVVAITYCLPAAVGVPAFTKFSERQGRRIREVAAQCFSTKKTATKAYPADPRHANSSSVRVRFGLADHMYVATVRLDDGMYELQSERYADYTAVPEFARCIKFAS